ncbi:aminotransferase class I/II-fold pyridoxal phosphate-dependent enzyme [Pseudorhizobium pelagicum]|uniref:aminotransferase class I/II-fold pyridoxal phosphate-dependent enzyme n=1 Tax=Pseudorhizobium pelagicum TaxID=1509405 RepID=UPI0009DDA24F
MSRGQIIGVVDDDADVRAALHGLLNAFGYDAILYSSAHDFLEHDHTSVGCIILDIQMPGISGLELQARLIEKGSTTPIIFMTGHLNARIRERALRQGAFCVLGKPVDQDHILSCIEKALGDQTPITSPEFLNLEEIAALARSHDALNLAQGFPDTAGPEIVRSMAASALLNGNNQYAPVNGLVALRSAVAKFYTERHRFPMMPDEVLITSGGTEALASSILALVSPGDEVLVIEPMYDAYAPLIRRAGGTVVAVRLSPPNWLLEEDAIRPLVTPKTRLLLLSQPANPMSHVFGFEELSMLAQVCVDNDLTVISDEVWENVTFDQLPHRPLASFPGMRGRTVKLGSAGKLLSLTGWKVGFVCAAANLLKKISQMHKVLTFSTPPNLQTAVAYGLGLSDEVFVAERTRLAASRDRFIRQVGEYGFKVLPSQASYFVYLDLPGSGISLDDASFCRHAIENAQVATIPLSALYLASPCTSLLRVCFARSDEVLDEGARRLTEARRMLQGS